MEKRKFYRNTHINGQPRHELADLKSEPTLTMHLLWPDKGMSFEETVKAFLQYSQEFPGEFSDPILDDHNLKATVALELVQGLQDTTIIVK